MRPNHLERTKEDSLVSEWLDKVTCSTDHYAKLTSKDWKEHDKDYLAGLSHLYQG